MQIRCYSCHKPFAINKEVVHSALDMMEEQDMQHYNAQCPFCKKKNRLSREELMRAAPDWTSSVSEAGENE